MVTRHRSWTDVDRLDTTLRRMLAVGRTSIHSSGSGIAQDSEGFGAVPREAAVMLAVGRADPLGGSLWAGAEAGVQPCERSATVHRSVDVGTPTHWSYTAVAAPPVDLASQEHRGPERTAGESRPREAWSDGRQVAGGSQWPESMEGGHQHHAGHRIWPG